MSCKGLNILAIIPARGGSKGIHRKNLIKIKGISLVGHAVMSAISMKWVDRVVLSTDDDEIAAEGRRYGADVPFMRPSVLSGDMVESAEVWHHAWIASEKHYGTRFDISLLLEPTSPLRKSRDIEETVRMLIETGASAAATVSQTPAHYTPHKTLKVEDGRIGFYLSDGAKYNIRQKIPTYYHRNGICYAVTRKTLVEKGYILEDNCVAVIIDRPVVNIDTPFEIEFAEWLLLRSEEEGCEL